jgi:hypothetical protein
MKLKVEGQTGATCSLWHFENRSKIYVVDFCRHNILMYLFAVLYQRLETGVKVLCVRRRWCLRHAGAGKMFLQPCRLKDGQNSVSFVFYFVESFRLLCLTSEVYPFASIAI